jgi:hypothetical protein
LKFLTVLKQFYKLEKEIFNDRNVRKIFISNEDQNYYNLMTGRNDAEILPCLPNADLVIKSRKNSFYIKNKIVWYGGVSTHKKKSIEWFINNVLNKIREENNSVEFHLWGTKTMQFHNPSKYVFAHG